MVPAYMESGPHSFRQFSEPLRASPQMSRVGIRKCTWDVTDDTTSD